VFLPLTHSIRLIGQYARSRAGRRQNPGSSLFSASELALFAAWRVTQGIYRYDASLYEAIVNTPITGNIPGELLRYLPEWCVYVETPQMTVPTLDGATVAVHGVWARLDHAPKQACDALTIALDTDEGIAPVQIALVGTLEEALKRCVTADLARPTEKYLELAERTYAGILSLLLYLCSDGSEIGAGDVKPSNPSPQRTSRGLRTFAADAATTWEVGVRIGAALRQARQSHETTDATPATGRQHRPHVRVMHWHTFLAGVERTERRVKWMPPIKVKFDEPDELPAVIRGVQ
jgi:hypothetical protein